MAAHERSVVFEGDEFSIVDFRCREHVATPGPEEPNPTYSIVFVRRGVFQRSGRGRPIVADANHILFFNEAEPYCFAHPVEGGDDCTIVTIAAPLVRQMVAHHAPRDADRTHAPFAAGHGIAASATARLHYELLFALRTRASSLAVEDLVFDLADAAVRDAYETHGRTVEQTRRSPLSERRNQEMTEEVKLSINRRLWAPPSLASLARAVGCSPFHLSRTFHKTEGVTLRRYVSRLRATIAAHHLARGAPDLTDLALDLGYSDHSHFTNAFRQEFGRAPSHFRARHSAERE
jgi:AraC-like DNA-binding protein